MTTTNSKTDFQYLIIPVFESDNLKSKLEKPLQALNFSKWSYFDNFKAAQKETIFWISAIGVKVYFVGLGKKKNNSEVSKTMRSFFYKMKNDFTGNIGIYLRDKEMSEFAFGISNGIYLSEYSLGAQKTTLNKKTSWFQTKGELNFLANKENEKSVAIDAKKGQKLAETQMKSMGMVDAPANYKTPQNIADIITESGKRYGYKVSVFDEIECEKRGLKALLAVGKGSIENPARFILMEYSHAEATKTVGLVGKGVTFDTGGVSLKPGDNMNYMKSDMGGAAAVFGAIEMAAKLNLKVNIVAAIPATENCIDSLAIKPGDVIGSYSGKTIEVINTDAEGRLILADGLAYIRKNYTTDILIDLATLTGNCIQALGYEAAALLSNNDSLAESIISAGTTTGEKTWRMPLWEAYGDMMKSDVADIKNLSTAPLAGAITAAKFLEEFIDGHEAWAHLDIAGVAFGQNENNTMKSATGYGVGLLVEVLERVC